MSLDTILVVLIVLCALVYFGKRVVASFGAPDCGCGCGKNCPSRKKR